MATEPPGEPPPVSELPPELLEAAGGWRENWRRDEEAWASEANRTREHGRAFSEVATEWMLRGDEVAVSIADRTFTGPVVATGDDLLAVRTPEGRVDVQTASRAVSAATSMPTPFVARVVAVGATEGLRPDAGPTTFAARLAELEARDAPVLVGSSLLPEELSGSISLGRDHLVVRPADGRETIVPRAWVAYVRPSPARF